MALSGSSSGLKRASPSGVGVASGVDGGVPGVEAGAGGADGGAPPRGCWVLAWVAGTSGMGVRAPGVSRSRESRGRYFSSSPNTPPPFLSFFPKQLQGMMTNDDGSFAYTESLFTAYTDSLLGNWFYNSKQV